MPITFWTFLIGALALERRAAVQRVLFSKDSILAQALGPAKLSAVCRRRVRCRADDVLHVPACSSSFSSASRETETAAHAHESPAVMTLPLMVLAVFSVIGGVIGVEGIYDAQFFRRSGRIHRSCRTILFEPFIHSPLAASLGLLVVAIGLVRRAVVLSPMPPPIPCPPSSARWPPR